MGHFQESANPFDNKECGLLVIAGIAKIRHSLGMFHFRNPPMAKKTHQRTPKEDLDHLMEA